MTAKNPERSLAEIRQAFNRILMDRGDASIQIAQDLIEENNLTLYDVSLATPELKLGIDPSTQGGKFQIGYPPANVIWAVSKRPPGSGWYTGWHTLDIRVYYGGSSWVDNASGGMIQERQDAAFRAVERAWDIVKIMKTLGGRLSAGAMEQEIRLARFVVVEVPPHTPAHLIAPHKAQRRQQRGRRARPRENSAPGAQGRSYDNDRQRQYLVIRINRDNGDTYATEVGNNVKHALEDLLEAAIPDEGSVIEYRLVWSQGVGAARVTVAGDRWYPISALENEDMIEEHDEDRYGPPRENPTPKALRMYRGFHQLEPKKLGDFHPDLVIPDVCVCVGDALNVLYRSDKLNPETGEDEGMIDYIHEHSRGVRVYRCDNGAEGEITNVPAWIRNTKELVKLGDCNGFAYADIIGGKKRKANATPPYPELYTTPSGKCLLVIQSKKRLLALIWGGRLGVEPRGIVH